MPTQRETSDLEGRLDVTAWASGPARGSCGNCDRRMIEMLAPAYLLSARDQIAPAYQLSALRVDQTLNLSSTFFSLC